MDYFAGINFIKYDDQHQCRELLHGKRFDGYFGIQYTHRGQLLFSMDENELVLYHGPVAFVSYPGRSFNYGTPPGMTRQHTFVCFQGERVEEFIHGGLLQLRTENAVLKIVNAERFLSTFHELHSHLATVGRGGARAVLLLEDLLLQLQEQPEAQMPMSSHLQPAFDLLGEKIRKSPELDWDFEREARRQSLSYPHFRRVFRAVHGMPPGRFLLECRLRKAEELLLHSETQVREVANLCGFEDEFYFSRIFKRHRLLSPFRFRVEFKR